MSAYDGHDAGRLLQLGIWEPEAGAAEPHDVR